MRILLLMFLSFFLYQNESDVILWCQEKKLVWDNFKGEPDLLSKHSAVTDCHIKWNMQTKKDTVIVNVISFMNRRLSWVKDNERSNSYLLKHEQFHFNIAEIFARKLRQSIINKRLPKTGIGNEIRKLADSNDICFKNYQDLYDSETSHSINRKKQEEWEKAINKELQSLDTYSNSIIIKFR